MKKLLAGLLVLGSLSAFSQDEMKIFKFQDKSNSKRSFTLKCEELECSSMLLKMPKSLYSGDYSNQRLVLKRDLEALSEVYTKANYDNTETAVADMNGNFQEGDILGGLYYATLEVPFEFVGDIFSSIFNRTKSQRTRTIYLERRGARKVLLELSKNNSKMQTIKVRKGIFNKMLLAILKNSKEIK